MPSLTRREFAFGAALNGVSVSALLDSGASHIVLDNAFGQRIGVVGDGNFSAHGLSGSTAGSVGRHPVETRFGNLTLVAPVNGQAGSTVELTMRDGSVRSLTLEDYF